MGSRSATTSPTGSVHSTPTHQTKPNTLDPFADIGNLGGSFGGQSHVMKYMNFNFVIVTQSYAMVSVLFISRSWLLQQAHHSYWTYAFHPSNGLPIATSSISPACRLSHMATRWRKWGRMAIPKSGPCPTAKAQPQPHPDASHIAPEPTQLQCPLLCDGRGLAQRRGQSTGRHG